MRYLLLMILLSACSVQNYDTVDSGPMFVPIETPWQAVEQCELQPESLICNSN